MKRGKFIVLEGIDRSGKSTQARLLAQSLKTARIPCLYIAFPVRDTAVGRLLDAYLRRENELDPRVAHLLFSANRWEMAQNIELALAEGKHVIADRYAYSGIAYSVANGLPSSWCIAPDVGLPLPDAVLYLDLSADIAAKRGAYGEERYEKMEFQLRVKKVYESLFVASTWHTVNASQEEARVRDDIEQIVNSVIYLS